MCAWAHTHFSNTALQTAAYVTFASVITHTVPLKILQAYQFRRITLPANKILSAAPRIHSAITTTHRRYSNWQCCHEQIRNRNKPKRAIQLKCRSKT